MFYRLYYDLKRKWYFGRSYWFVFGIRVYIDKYFYRVQKYICDYSGDYYMLFLKIKIK